MSTISSIGKSRDGKRVNQNDTAEIYAVLYGEDGAPITSTPLAVEFTIRLPDGTDESGSGTVTEDGEGFYRLENTAQLGHYQALARFTLDTGEVRSTTIDFQVIDPFNPPAPTPEEEVANAVWFKLEDCFDSDEGGPWLRDMTLRYFNREKIPKFIPDALMEINLQHPPTNVTLDYFTTPSGSADTDFPVLSQAVLVSVIRHLMRSYTEIPVPQGAQVVHEDRTQYLQRWQLIYQIETEKLTRILALWKRQFLGLGSAKVLVDAKAGRLIPAPMRSRMIGRGYR